MILKKIFLVFAVVAGLCAFDAQIENPRLPQVAQTEIVISSKKEIAAPQKIILPRPVFLVLNEEPVLSSVHLYQQSLLIETQHHHSSL